MSSSLPGVRLFFVRGEFLLPRIRDAARRRLPGITPLFDFPGFRLSAFQSEISAWIGGTSKADFIPGPRVRIVHLGAIPDDECPIVMHRKALPDFLRARQRFCIVDRFQ
jgi:hypothetical protein